MRNGVVRVSRILVCSLAASASIFSCPAFSAEKKSSERCPFTQVGRVTAAVSKPADLLRRRKAADLPSTPPAPFLSSGKSYLANAPLAKRYVSDVADRLLKSWPGKYAGDRPTFHVNSASYYQAEVMFDRGVIVTMGFLDIAESDAEVAFILGHELAHILLGHVDDNDTMRRSLAKLDVLQRGIDYISHISAMSVESAEKLRVNNSSDSADDIGQDLEQHNRKVKDYIAELQGLLERVAKPVWKSAQEDEADLMAMELMLRAGYSPSGAALGIMNLKEAQATACAELKKLVADLDSFRDKAERYDWAQLLDDPEQAAAWQQAVRPLKKSAEEKLRKTVMASAMPQAYRTAKKRQARLAKHMKTELIQSIFGNSNAPDGGLKKLRRSAEFQKNVKSSGAIVDLNSALRAGDLETATRHMTLVDTNTSQGRILKNRLRTAQGKPGDAVENLRIASGFKVPSLRVFEQYNLALLESERFSEVLVNAQRANKLFADDIHFLPESIYISVARNPDTPAEADKLLNKCLAAPRADIWKICEAARTGTSAQFREAAKLILDENCKTTNCKEGRFRLPWRLGIGEDKSSGAGR